LVKVLPGESNFAKACEVYGAALAKFPPANQTLPKLTEFMVSFGKVLPVDTEFAKVGGIDDSALANRAAFRACNKVIIS